MIVIKKQLCYLIGVSAFSDKTFLPTCFLLMKMKVFPLNKVLLASLGRKPLLIELIVSSFKGGR